MAIALLLCLLAASLAQGVDSDGNSTETSGSGSGDGDTGRNCSTLQCSHGCNVTDGEARCYCPRGYLLDETDFVTCLPCPGGLYGVNCESTCNCNTLTGNTCNRISGMCVCNLCYNGSQCGMMTGSTDCYVQFLGISDKTYNNLRSFYGTLGYPVPPAIALEALATSIMETTPDVISDVSFMSVNRTDVNQGPLVKLSWQVRGNTAVGQQALETLSDKVKLGTIRATYIAQDSLTGFTTVTLNSGVKEAP